MTYLSHKFENERIAVLGASRGLGRAFCEKLSETSKNCQFFLSSRKEELLTEINLEKKEIFAKDFSKPSDQDFLLDELKRWRPDRIFYFAGGGPYGKFSEKRWKDHLWGLEVSFLFPAKVLHQVTAKQMVFIGSAIAENSSDGMAASYSASKHALKGLVSSVVAEGCEIDLRLFSPGYMDTDLLPPNASVRQNEDIWPVENVAEALITWAVDPAAEWHYKLQR